MNDDARRSELADAAVQIWRAGVDAVDSKRLVINVCRHSGDELEICGHTIDRASLNRLVIVGAGKAGAGMAEGVESFAAEAGLIDRVEGWVNVPADCVRNLQKIHLHAARPAGVNEPTAEGVAGSTKILDLVGSLNANDICLVLLSGGGSALLPAPVEAISLDDKQTVTRCLMHVGATINQLNCVRKQLSRIKGGGLARASKAGMTIALIVSDVIGDPLDVIASGPTVDDPNTPDDALAVLQRFDPDRQQIPAAVWSFLESGGSSRNEASSFDRVHNHIIGNNETALSAATVEAQRLGYAVHSLGSNNAGVAGDVGRELAALAVQIRDDNSPLAPPACVLSGGEPVVHLTKTDQPQKGGRNQELVLAALAELWDDGCRDIALLSGGTDGEDGPTDAAGAIVDADVLSAAKAAGLHPAEYLANNNSYPYFEQLHALLQTGPTHTNVMDLRVVVVL